ncbi:MAG: prepilin-type N-terminal cleavage/methylation domain-containing protein [Epsilonproteobacteria bacterium]|nr:prepilin-type N-terminal cleavage/methylation domain-containing protein [Campylobacterota bacterium]
MKPAFTMMELIFVIVVIGILAAIAVPKLMVTRNDAVIVKGKSQVSAIRNGISLQKSRNMLKGDSTPYPDKLDNVTSYNVDDQKLFYFNDGNASNILEYPIYSKKGIDGHWVKTAANKYAFYVRSDKNVSFEYNSTTGSFDCNHADSDCKRLAQ